MSEEGLEDDEQPPIFRTVWSEYTSDHLGKEADLHVPEQFDRGEWETVGYLPPDRRSDTEIYDWSKFYDFWFWLKQEGYICDGE
jgi:hypothetical protein